MTRHVSIFYLICRISRMREPLKGVRDRRQVISRSNSTVPLSKMPIMLRAPSFSCWKRHGIDSRFYIIRSGCRKLVLWAQATACKWQVGVRTDRLLSPQTDPAYYYALIRRIFDNKIARGKSLKFFCLICYSELSVHKDGLNYEVISYIFCKKKKRERKYKNYLCGKLV